MNKVDIFMGGSIMKKTYNMGIDVGSTTVKTVVLDRDLVVFKEYKRHFSDVKKAVREILQDVYNELGDISISVVITGSGGIDISKYLNLKFVQEVIASTKAITSCTNLRFKYFDISKIGRASCRERV